MDVDLQRVLQMFLAESEEGFAAMEEALVALESQPADDEALGTIFRVAHTLKGNASLFGFDGVTELAHGMEDVLDRLRHRELPVTAALVTTLLQAVDVLRELVPAAAAGNTGLPPVHQALLERLAKAGAADVAAPSTTAAPSWRAQPGEGSGSRRQSWGLRPEDHERERTLRVDRTELDRMLNLTGEIAVARGRSRQLLQDLGGRASEGLLNAHRELDRLSLELQELVMKVRMVPLGPIFRRYVRTVRDVAEAHGRQACLLIEGDDVEVDTTVVEHIHDPLTHMIRNAIDHGIEPPEARARRGKDPCGTVTLRSYRDAGSIVIQIGDDGAGLDRERIAARARELGTMADPAALTDQELQRLILEPGFSTAPQVTDLSGRGVGLDVVRRNVERLRGTVAIASRAGEGTTITLRLPLTLAIIAAFAVGIASETYLLPLDDVVECLELPSEECPHADGRGVLSRRGGALPYLRLRQVLGIDAPAPSREHVVIVRHEGGLVGLAVDVLQGESQTVIKPLGRLFHGLPGIAGSAILGSGRVALILDVGAIVGAILRHATPRGTEGSEGAWAARVDAPRGMPATAAQSEG